MPLPTVFFSYSHKDEGLRDRLETMLKAMQREGLIATWHDRRITAGASVDDSISQAMEAAAAILLLVSPDFIASDYCYETEMARAMQRHAEGSAVVIPVILRPCDWHRLPFGKLMATPVDGRPVSRWPDQDEAFLDVARAIRAALERQGAPSGSGRVLAPPAVAQVAPTLPRSSNLSVSKRLSEADRDRFLSEAFEFIARFFEGSLGELKARNGDIETAFRRIDANRFTATLYRAGTSISRCTIARGGMFSHGITYSTDDSGNTNSINDNMSVDSDDHGFFLKPLKMSMRGGRAGGHLTHEGAAEYYWAILMEPLQRRR